MSARKSDVRDIAALVWLNGIPADIHTRAKQILPFPEVLAENINNKILPDISNDMFIDSWRGTFITTAFGEKDKGQIIEKIRELTNP